MMTTPERLKRRQLLEGLVIITLAIFTIAQAIYFNLEDRNQRSCIAEKFTEFSRVSSIRADIAEQDTELQARETAVSKAIWLTYAEAAGLVKDDPTKPLPKKAKERLQRQLVDQLLEYKRVINDVEEQRRELQRNRRDNPVPPFPVGICDR